MQKWNDIRCKAANMLSMVTGLRAGELLGLRVCDIGEDCLYIRHSWNPVDKLKTTKTNEERIVELPFPSVIQSLHYIASLNPHSMTNESFVFWSLRIPDKPMEKITFVHGLRKALINYGISETEAKGYSFHGWRHFYTTYMRPKIEIKLLQSQTGHKTLPMIDRYSDHNIPGDREKIREAQIEVFSAILPTG